MGEVLKKIKVVFLDVDGVLNCHTTRDKCGSYKGIEDKKVSLLKEIVDSTGAVVVLVSSWKEYWYKDPTLKPLQDNMALYLDKKLAKQDLKIVDKTDDSDSPFFRGEGILEYLNALKIKGVEVDKFIILDDEMFDYRRTKLTKHLIKTDYYQSGLEEKHVRKAVTKL